MFDSLLIYIDENTKFNRNEVVQAISSIEKVCNVSATQKDAAAKKYDYVLLCEYCNGTETVTVRVDIDLECIFVKNFSNAALSFAFELQQRLNVSLKTTDSDYSFLAELDRIKSVKELNKVANKGIYMDKK